MLHVSALASMIVTLGSPENGKKIVRCAAMNQARLCRSDTGTRDLVQRLSV